MGHRPWRDLFQRLPPRTQAEIKEKTAQVLAELDRADWRHGEGQRDDESVPACRAALNR